MSQAILSGNDLATAKRRELERVHAELWGHGISLLSFVIWVFFGLSSSLRDALGGGAGFTAMLLYILVFSLIGSVISFPVSYYYGYVREKRDGMLKQNLVSWLTDQLKQLGVGLVLSSAIMLGLFAIFRNFPTLWLPFALGLVTLVFAVVLMISPMLARMRFKSAPLENPELEARVVALFARADQKLGKVSKWLFGEKVKQSNAALIPVGTSTEVLISDTLMQSTDIDGIEVVLAHELGHRVHKDIQKNIIFGWLSLVFSIVAAYFLINALTGVGGIGGSTDVAALPILLFAFTLVGEISSLFRNEMIRRAEYAADRYALDQTRNFPAFERAFRALAKENLSDPDPPAWVEFWLHDHPSIEKRIQAGQAWATANP
jgi:STE24 endopeptidase